MSEQNKILRRHDLQDMRGPPSAVPVSNLHSRLVAASYEMADLRKAGLGEPDSEQDVKGPGDTTEGPYGKSLMEDELPGQRERNKELAERLNSLDPWKHRAQHMRCQTCMWWVPKAAQQEERTTHEAETGQVIGRCRHNAPTMKGYPATFPTDWCGDHKLDETKL